MSDDRISMTVELGACHIVFEGPRDSVEKQVHRLTAAVIREDYRPAVQKEESGSALESMTERALVDLKQPHGHLETVAVLAFCLAAKGQEEFTETDLRKAYIRADIRPPKVVAQALRDAKNKREFIEPGKTRGTYRLSNHGDRFVRFDLGNSKST